jgi:hypothetical protein
LRWRPIVAAGLGAFLTLGGPAVADQHYVVQGVAMDVTTEPLGAAPTGQDVRLTVRLSDAVSGAPLAAANPAAWLSVNRRGSPPTEQSAAVRSLRIWAATLSCAQTSI